VAKISLDIDAEATAEELAAFVARTIRRAGAEGAVLGLSGGLDSATAAYLAVRALGPERVWPFSLPYRTSSEESRRDAELVAAELGVELTTVDVTRQVDAYFAAVGEAPPVRVGNKAARERMSVLYDQAKARGALVVGTGNRTEKLLGYTTLWGDMACDLAPLGGLWKTQVRAVAQALGVPRQVIEKAPTADLWPGQTDEGEIGIAYETADAVLHLLVDRRLSQSGIAALGFEEEEVARVRRLMRSTAHKRRMPPSPRPPRLAEEG
jgi:NAD+ synthase